MAFRADSALPYTTRLSDPVRYDEASHALACEHCDARYESSVAGTKGAIRCCHEIVDVDRDDVPIRDIPLKLIPAERGDRDYSAVQLRFL